MNFHLLSLLLFFTSLSLPTKANEAQFLPGLTLEISDWGKENYRSWPTSSFSNQPQDLSWTHQSVRITFDHKKVGLMQECKLSAENQSPEIRRLRFRWRQYVENQGGDYWDGNQRHSSVKADVKRIPRQFVFPISSYSKNDSSYLLGLAPHTFCSRFENACRIENGKMFMECDLYLALHPQQKDHLTILQAKLSPASDYIECIEEIHKTYASFFKPIEGADPRIHGCGGYIRSQALTRKLQFEFIRRRGLDWEWCYAPFQKAGIFWPEEKYWDVSRGYVTENPLISIPNTTVQDWIEYNQERFTAGNSTCGMFYYFYPLHAEIEVMKKYFTDSYWPRPDGVQLSPVHGWVVPFYSSQSAWSQNTSFGEKTYRDIVSLWNNLEIAGLAMDCACGDYPYSGETLPKESAKAFDDKGRVYVQDGVLLANYMDFMHSLPPRKDGRRAANIPNMPVTYLPAFHGDAILKEGNPYDYMDIIPILRYMIGQKPFHWWSTIKYDDVLEWEKMTPEEIREAIQGILDFYKQCSAQYGISLSKFYTEGYPEMREWVVKLNELLRAGWRAATYVKIEKLNDGKNKNETEPLWISRYGDGVHSYFAFSSPEKSEKKFDARLATDRFGAQGSIYMELNGVPTQNHVSKLNTLISMHLKNHEIRLLKKIGSIESDQPVELMVRQEQFPNGSRKIIVSPLKKWSKNNKIQWIDEFSNQSIHQEGDAMVVELNPTAWILPNKSWLTDVCFGDEKKSSAIIVVSESDRQKLQRYVTHLECYWQFYQVSKTTHLELRALKENQLRNELKLPVVSSLEAPEVAQAKTVFLLGSASKFRAQIKPDQTEPSCFGEKDDGKLYVSFWPGKDPDEGKSVLAFLSEMDKRFPEEGFLSSESCLKKSGLAGKTFFK